MSGTSAAASESGTRRAGEAVGAAGCRLPTGVEKAGPDNSEPNMSNCRASVLSLSKAVLVGETVIAASCSNVSVSAWRCYGATIRRVERFRRVAAPAAPPPATVAQSDVLDSASQVG